MRESAAEALGSLFEPEVILPDQFNGREFQGIDGGERKLMAALLSDGIEAFIHHAMLPSSSVKGRSVKSKNPDPADWIFTRDESYIFSFDSVCSCLGISAEYLRLGLARYLKSNQEKKSGVGITAWKKIRRPRK